MAWPPCWVSPRGGPRRTRRPTGRWRPRPWGTRGPSTGQAAGPPRPSCNKKEEAVRHRVKRRGCQTSGQKKRLSDIGSIEFFADQKPCCCEFRYYSTGVSCAYELILKEKLNKYISTHMYINSRLMDKYTM